MVKRKTELAIVTLTIALTLGGILSLANRLAAREERPAPSEPSKLLVFNHRKLDASAGRQEGERLFLMMGDSHLSCVTGTHRGQFFDCVRDDPSDPSYQADEESVVLGRFAERAKTLPGAPDWTFARLGFTAARPAELLLLISNLIYQGRAPGMVTIGLRWSACTLMPLVRPEYLVLLKDAGFAESFQARLRDLGSTAPFAPLPPRVQNSSLVEAIDKRVAGLAGIDTRGQEFLRAVIRDGERGLNRLAGFTAFDHSRANCDLQLGYMELLLRTLQKEQIARVCYLPPEQPRNIPEYESLIPWIAPNVARLNEMAASTQCPLIDAQRAVPNEHFGWNFIIKDPVHMNLSGHDILANFIYEEGMRRQLWLPLKQHAM